MDLLWIAGFVVSACAWAAAAERHSVYWNSTNPKFLWDVYAVEVKLNDYLDIVCPHYPLGEVPSQDAERYVLYMVEREDYDSCKPQSYDQMRWECGHPFAPHAPEKFSEKFQRFTPFTLGKEFRQGESYYYISKPLHHHGQECLSLRVDVVAADGSQEARVAKEEVRVGLQLEAEVGLTVRPTDCLRRTTQWWCCRTSRRACGRTLRRRRRPSPSSRCWSPFHCCCRCTETARGERLLLPDTFQGRQ